MGHILMKGVLAGALAALCAWDGQGQTLNEAKQFYNEGKFAEAKPVFERFVKQSPGNASYNLWYGACCFETGDLATAEKYLNVAVRCRVIDGFRYMGELYCKTFRYEQAVEMYEEYIKYQTQKKRDTEAAELRLDELENAARMLDKVEAVQVIDSVVVGLDDLLSAYRLSEESGTLLPANEFFTDGRTDTTVVYKNQKGDKVFYAKPTEANHYCLFTQSWLLDHWGDEKQLRMNTDSESDDNYPFVLPDGVTVYYASKGNGSLGGYDLFVTRYNTESDSYLMPEQLSMPFNSPYNDYMMVIDEGKGLGWFASDRFQPEGKVCVYLFIPNEDHARVETDDMELKRAWASLMPIRTTWKEGSDYSKLIALAHQEVPYGQPEKKGDFEFPVTASKVYYNWSDFRSAEAKALYQKATDTRREIDKLEQDLEKLRKDYAAANAGRKEQLAARITSAEEKLNVLLPQTAELEKQARNAEAPRLRNR